MRQQLQERLLSPNQRSGPSAPCTLAVGSNQLISAAISGGRTSGKPHPSIRCVLLPRGGIAPAARRRSRLALMLAEHISRGIASGWSTRGMAGRLGRAASTVSREITRHGDALPIVLVMRTTKHGTQRCGRNCLLSVNRKLRNIVASKLILDWSPDSHEGRSSVPSRSGKGLRK
jgi:Helix-turn-helix domain